MEEIKEPVIINPLLHDPIKFSQYIETAASKSDTTYLDIMIDFCEKNDVEYDVIIKYITPTLKQKIRYESEELRYYKKSIKSLFDKQKPKKSGFI